MTTAPGATLSQDQLGAFTTAAAAWSSVLTNTIAVDLQVGFVALGSNILGSTSFSTVTANSASVIANLTAAATSAEDRAAVVSLALLPPATATIGMSSAQAKALGYTTSGIDAVIEFSNSFPFATSRNADGSIPAGMYDLVGVAEHEIAHALGFFSSFDFGGAPTLLDLFRFNGLGSRATTTGSAYFSIDDGRSAIANFSPGGANNYQASHWLMGTGALMDPAIAPGTVQNITALDREALDVLGYTLASTTPVVATNVPEPAGLVVWLMGLVGLAVGRRRRAAA